MLGMIKLAGLRGCHVSIIQYYITSPCRDLLSAGYGPMVLSSYTAHKLLSSLIHILSFDALYVP